MQGRGRAAAACRTLPARPPAAHLQAPPPRRRYALGVYGFRFPFVLTSAHMLFGFLALLPYHLSHNWEAHKAKLRQQWRGLAAIGAFLATGISLNNISLVYISLSLNQVIRCGGAEGGSCGRRRRAGRG